MDGRNLEICAALDLRDRQRVDVADDLDTLYSEIFAEISTILHRARFDDLLRYQKYRVNNIEPLLPAKCDAVIGDIIERLGNELQEDVLRERGQDAPAGFTTSEYVTLGGSSIMTLVPVVVAPTLIATFGYSAGTAGIFGLFAVPATIAWPVVAGIGVAAVSVVTFSNTARNRALKMVRSRLLERERVLLEEILLTGEDSVKARLFKLIDQITQQRMDTT